MELMTAADYVLASASQLQGLTPSQFQSYRGSTRWQRRRRAFRILLGDRCGRCGTRRRRLEVHHRHYLTVGFEELCDVELLCRPCHVAADPSNGHRVLDLEWFRQAEAA